MSKKHDQYGHAGSVAEPLVSRVHPGRNALFSTAVVVAAATIGSLSTDPTSTWYRTLKKPDWQPSATAFPIAWTSLYTGAIITSTKVLNRLEREGRYDDASKYRRALVANMALNAGWSWLFFRKKDLPAAALGAGVLTASTVHLAHRAGKAGFFWTLSLVPYALWNGFATGLSSDVWLRNQ